VNDLHKDMEKRIDDLFKKKSEEIMQILIGFAGVDGFSEQADPRVFLRCAALFLMGGRYVAGSGQRSRGFQRRARFLRSGDPSARPGRARSSRGAAATTFFAPS
jgi:hypothetical protein